MSGHDIDKADGLTRRELLHRGLRIGGAVWAIPVIQILNMAPAGATGNSHPPQASANESPRSPRSPKSPKWPSSPRPRWGRRPQ